MILSGKNLFKLELVSARLHNYYMDSEGRVYSTRTHSKPVTLGGSISSGKRYYTLDGMSWSHQDLVRSAKNHRSFASETAEPNNIEIPPEVVTTSKHASTIENGIACRGSVIATVIDGVLVFGTKPAIHISDKSAKAEMERLAALQPGTQFVALKITSAVKANGLSWS